MLKRQQNINFWEGFSFKLSTEYIIILRFFSTIFIKLLSNLNQTSNGLLSHSQYPHFWCVGVIISSNEQLAELEKAWPDGVTSSQLHCLFLSRSPTKQKPIQAGSLESSSLTGSLALCPDMPHCQCCVSSEGRLKRLSCGHLYCNPCCHQIVNLAFEDIEGLSDYPCPMCKSNRQLRGLGPSSSGCLNGSYTLLQQLSETDAGSGWG